MRPARFLQNTAHVVFDVGGSNPRRASCYPHEAMAVHVEEVVRPVCLVRLVCNFGYPVCRFCDTQIGDSTLRILARDPALAFPTEHGLRLEAVTFGELFHRYGGRLA